MLEDVTPQDEHQESEPSNTAALKCAQKIVAAVRKLDEELHADGVTDPEVAKPKVVAIYDQFESEMPEAIRTQFGDAIAKEPEQKEKDALKVACIADCYETFHSFPFDIFLALAGA